MYNKVFCLLFSELQPYFLFNLTKDGLTVQYVILSIFYI
jgi:hypothetical protein